MVIVICICGSGSVVANRLSEMPDWKILVLEAGEDEDITSQVPILARDSWMTRQDWNYTTEKQKRACLGKRASTLFDSIHPLPIDVDLSELKSV